jgi:choline dehydrogenase/4-pyridoxate dehydrogenase
MRADYDYVIVGAGAAGCVLARRLTEQDDVDVLLIEAGDWPRGWRFAMPMAWPTLLSADDVLWRYDDPDAPARSGQLVAGRVVGGSSSVNAMTYVRGHRADYDRWAQAGLPAMAYEAVLPYFKRLENWEGGADAYRGGDGPIAVTRSRLVDPALTALMQAADAQGARTAIDYNGADQAGFGITQLTNGRGRRSSAATGYLAPVLSRGNIHLATRASATRVVLEGGRAAGVAYRQGGQNKIARAAREVIVTAGAVKSPQLLMLSGIGDPAALRLHGIAVQAAAPGVGGNLRNHVSVGLTYARRHRGPIGHGLRADRLAGAMLAWSLRGRGLLATPPNAATGFVETPRSRGGVPDIQILFFATTAQARMYWPLVQKPYADGFMLSAVLLRPESAGAVSLRSDDPAASPLVAQNVLAAQQDRDVLADGIRRIDALAHESALASVSAGAIGRHPESLAAPALAEFIAAAAMPMFHPSGTCRMGAAGDAFAVVDAHFRVHGVERLRVVDASVMPDLIGGNPFACVTMLAEMASDHIRRRDK